LCLSIKNKKKGENMNTITPKLSTPKAAPSFGQIDYRAAEKVINRVLTTKETKEFVELVNKNSTNKLADVVLFDRGRNRLCANVADAPGKIYAPFKCLSYNQWPFEPHLHFIKRMCSKANKRAAELLEIAEKNKILNSGN